MIKRNAENLILRRTFSPAVPCSSVLITSSIHVNDVLECTTPSILFFRDQYGDLGIESTPFSQPTRHKHTRHNITRHNIILV